MIECEPVAPRCVWPLCCLHPALRTLWYGTLKCRAPRDEAVLSGRRAHALDERSRCTNIVRARCLPGAEMLPREEHGTSGAAVARYAKDEEP